MSNAILIDHPLIKHKLTMIRDKHTRPPQFRTLLKEISFLMAYEVTRDLPTEEIEIETPLTKTLQPRLKGREMALHTILRAGNGFLEGLLELIPNAKVGNIGIYRDEEAHEPVPYYFKVPDHLDERFNLVVDPMLATGGTAVATIDQIKKAGAKDIAFMCLLCAPEGVAALSKAHPDVKIYTAAIDEKLNENCYIVPGLGDAGDRIYSTL